MEEWHPTLLWPRQRCK